MKRSTNETRLAPGTRAIATTLLALALLSVTLVSASADLVDRLEPIDDVTPGQRSAQQVCADEEGTECVNATLETAPFACDGGSLEAFHCNLTYWLNLTVTGSDVCGNASVNLSEDLAVDACSGPVPGERVSSGPVTVTYNGTNISRVVNSTAWLCLDADHGTECQRWQHDPVLLPSWREWRPKTISPDNSTSRTMHHICLGTSERAVSPGDPGPGCARFAVRTGTECVGVGTHECDLHLHLRVFVNPKGARICGALATDFEQGGDVLACGFQPGGGLDMTYVDTRHYDEDEVPFDGPRTVVIEAEACAYAFRVNATVHCETFHHVAEIYGHPCCGTLEGIAMDEANYWVTRANHTPAPSVYP